MNKHGHTAVHTRIGHERSLCGRDPKRGTYRIVSFSDFFIAEEKDQCETCLSLVEKRGYNLGKLRLQYQTIHEHAQGITQNSTTQEMSSYLSQAKRIINDPQHI